MDAAEDRELELTSGMEGAHAGKPIRLHNKPKKAQDYVVAPEGTDKSFYALLLLHLFSSLLINVLTYIMIDYACTGDDWSVIENIMSEPNDKRNLVSIDDSHLKRRHLERLLLPEEFLGDEVSIYRQDLAALYLLLLLVARYKLSNHKTICYHLFQYLQRIPCWNRLSFPSAPRWVRHSYLSKGLR